MKEKKIWNICSEWGDKEGSIIWIESVAMGLTNYTHAKVGDKLYKLVPTDKKGEFKLS